MRSLPKLAGSFICMLLDHRQDDLNALIDAQVATVQAQVIVLCHAPGLTGVVLIVDLAALVLFSQTRFGTLFAFTVETDNAVSTEIIICVDEYMQTIFSIFEDVVGIATHDNAGAFFRQLHNGAALDAPQKVSSGQAVHDTGYTLMGKGVGKAGFAGGMFAVLLHEFRGETTFEGNLVHQLLVVKGNTQPIGYFSANGASTATKFTADGDNFLFHGEASSRLFIFIIAK